MAQKVRYSQARDLSQVYLNTPSLRAVILLFETGADESFMTSSAFYVSANLRLKV